MNTLGYLNVTFASSSLSRFACLPRENYLKSVSKVLGCLKKHLKKGCNMDPSPFIVNFPSNQAIPKFNHQHDHLSESLDPTFPEPLLHELASNMLVGANHRHDSITGKAIIGFLVLVASTPAF